MVVQDQAYTHCLHGIKEVMQDELTDAVSNLGQINGQDSSNGGCCWAATFNAKEENSGGQGRPRRRRWLSLATLLGIGVTWE